MASKKVLLTASIPLHFRAFHLPYLKWFKDRGYETHVACNGYEDLPYVDKLWQVDFARSPFSLRHPKAYKQLLKIINANNFTLINCHTPMASILTRIASIGARKRGTKLIYTAHGFHFFKGAPWMNWLSFFPVEVLLTMITDTVVTINDEDYNTIKKHGSKSCDYFLIPGIGVEGSRFFPVSAVEKRMLRIKKNIDVDKFILIYAAEYISRKNHQFFINAVKNNRSSFANVEILFAGRGPLEGKLKNDVNVNGLEQIFKFIGFRNDIVEIYRAADLGITASKQEGLAINVVEEMMSGLPVIASSVRGHKEIIDHGINGYLFALNNERDFVDLFLDIYHGKEKYSLFSTNAIAKAQTFELKNSVTEMTSIYKKYI